MKTNIINIGNSKGIIIPSKLLKVIGMGKEASIDVKDNKIVIEPIEKNPRKDWTDKLIELGSLESKEILMPSVFEDETFAEWEW